MLIVYERYENLTQLVATFRTWAEFDAWRDGWMREHPKSTLLVTQAIAYAPDGSQRMPTQ
jgi:hypothetical protein